MKILIRYTYDYYEFVEIIAVSESEELLKDKYYSIGKLALAHNQEEHEGYAVMEHPHFAIDDVEHIKDSV